MAIANDLSHLPRAGDGLQPDAKPRFVQVLVEKWAEDDDEHEATRTKSGKAFRHSDAGKCARLLGYKAVGIPASDPMDLTGTWNVNLGKLLHDEWQGALRARFPGAMVEVKVPSLDDRGIGYIDAVIRWANPADVPEEVRGPGWSPDGPYTVVYELKSIGGWGFKSCIGKARKGAAADGPRTDHLLQGAINGLQHEADEVVIGYLAKEALGKKIHVDQEIDRFLAEWTFTREQFEPVARDELQRVEGLLSVVEDGNLPRRITPDMPAGAEIVDPSKGTWEVRADGRVIDTGSVWSCDYCSHQTLCATTKAGRIPVETVVQVGDPFEGLEALADGSEVA